MNDAPRRALVNLGLFALLAVSVLVVDIENIATAPETWLLVAAISALVGLVVIDVLWWLNLRIGRPLTPAQAALEAFALGLTFALTQVFVASALGLELVRGMPLTVISVTITVGAFGLLTILIGQGRRAERERMHEFFMQGSALEAARVESAGIIRELHVALASDIDAALSPARISIERRLVDQEQTLANDDWSTVASELRLAARATVRPLSRHLWNYPPPRLKGPGLVRVLRTIVTEQPFQPMVLILIYWATTFGGAIVALGWINGVISLVIGTGLIAGILGGANVLMRRNPRHHALFFIAATIALQLTGLLSFLLRDAWGATPYTWEEYALSCIGGVALIFVTSGFGSMRTYRADLARTLRADIDKELRESIVASAHLAQLARESARVLHGSVQTRLVACAVAIEQASSNQDVEAFRAAMHEAHDALFPPALDVEETRPLAEQLEHTISLWSGLCTVGLTVDPSLSALSGAQARDIRRVVEEAINNAITHGEANQIAIGLSHNDGAVVIDLTDNGLGPQCHEPGLGSALFDSVCESWELTAVPQGSRFHGRVATSR